MKTIRRCLAMIFVVPGVIILAIGLAVGAGFGRACDLLGRFSKTVQGAIDERS